MTRPAAMDPSSSDDECIPVQLDGSDMAPNAFKVIWASLLWYLHWPTSSDTSLPKVHNEEIEFGTWWATDWLGKSDGVSHVLCHGRYISAFIFEVVIIRCDKMARDRGIVHMIDARAYITWCHMITSHVCTWPWDSSTIQWAQKPLQCSAWQHGNLA